MIRATELGIIADDLTGACDAASAFAPFAGPVLAHVDLPRAQARRKRYCLEVLNTQSRLLSPSKSARTVTRAARMLEGAPVVYKKIDSVLRGPAGAELEAIAKVFPRHRIFVIPAIPEMGKTTQGGCLFEHDIPAHLTDYGKDPLSPLVTNDIHRLLSMTGRVDVEVVDVATSEDLASAVDRALESGEVILAGSVGLADTLSLRLVKETAAAGAGVAGPGPAGAAGTGLPAAQCILVVSGSRYPRTAEQLRFAAAAFGEEVFTLASRVSSAALGERCRGRKVVFLEIEAESLATRGSHPPILEFLMACDPHALGIIGGETACRVLHLIGASGLLVLGRRQQGMPFGVIRDGMLAGRPFATKGGSVGTPDACVQMVATLQQGWKGET